MQPIIAVLLLVGTLAQNGAEVPVRPIVAVGQGASATDDYRIGREDAIDVNVLNLPAIAGTYKAGNSGIVAFPIIGDVEVLGKTTRELARHIETLLRDRILTNPVATVTIKEYVSQPVSILGVVKIPGVYQMKGRKTLLDIVAMAGGLGGEAGTIQVLRNVPEGTPSPVAIDVEEMMNAGRADLNIEIQVGDVINVLPVPVEYFYIVGEMQKPGDYAWKKGRQISLGQALALGGGTTLQAKKKEVLIIRYREDLTKEEIQVDLSKDMKSPQIDMALMPNDILFVPAKNPSKGISRALELAISVVTARAMYR